MTEQEKKAAEEAALKAAEAKKEGEGKNEEDFAKGDEKVDANKFNQALRKAREAEAEKREAELEKKRLEAIVKQGTKIQPKKEVPPKKEEEDEEDDFWGTEKKEEEKKASAADPDEIKAIINEQIRPFVEAETQRKQVERKQARQTFYDQHPEYLRDAEKWAELLDELTNSIVPSGDYYQDLEKAHRIIGGEDFNQVQIEQKKKEFANDAGSGSEGGGARNQGAEGDYKMSALDKKIMEGTGVNAETIKMMRELQKEGRLSLEF